MNYGWQWNPDRIAAATERLAAAGYTLAIDNPETLPKNTTQLELMLRHLRSVQAISDEQVAAVKAAVDCSKEVELTKADSLKIRGIK